MVWRYPPPNTLTIDPSVDQVGHKPEGRDLIQRSLTYRPSSGTGAHAHPAPSTKPGTGAGIQDDTGADPGKSVIRFDGTPKGHRTPFKGTADGAGTGIVTKAVSRTATRKTGNRAKACLSYLYSEAVQEKIAFPTVGNTALLSPRTPFSPRGKRKLTGLSPEQNFTPPKRAIIEPSLPSPSTEQLQSSLELTMQFIGSIHEREFGTDSTQTKQKERQQRPLSSNSNYISTYTKPKRNNNSGNNKRGPTSATPKTPSVAESIYTFITINIVRGMLTPPRAMEVINRFINYIHPDNIQNRQNRWGSRKKLGPTFIVRKAVLAHKGIHKHQWTNL